MMTNKGAIFNLKNIKLRDEHFYQLCQTNKYYRLEQTAKEESLIMSPVGAV